MDNNKSKTKSINSLKKKNENQNEKKIISTVQNEKDGFNNKNLGPERIKFLCNLTKDSYSDHNWLDNTFTTFESINNILYLIYSNKDRSIIAYNIIDNKKIIEIKNAHNKFITNFRYYYDKFKNIDLIMSISSFDNNLKLWNVNNWTCIIDIKNINSSGSLVSACFLKDNNINYIVASNDRLSNCEKIKIFDFEGKKIKEINDSNYLTCYIDSYYDNKFSKNYIITGNYKFVQSYDYNENKLYHKYCDEDQNSHISIIFINNNDTLKFIESCMDGNIRIWDFHSCILIDKIKIIDQYLIGICLWNDDYLFIGTSQKSIILFDLKNKQVIKNLIGSNQYIVCVKKINHPKYGECLISQGDELNQIKLWVKK